MEFVRQLQQKSRKVVNFDLPPDSLQDSSEAAPAVSSTSVDDEESESLSFTETTQSSFNYRHCYGLDSSHLVVDGGAGDWSSDTDYYSFDTCLGDLSATTAVGITESFYDNPSYYDLNGDGCVSPHEVELMKVRLAHDPPSYYHIPDMNKKPVDVVPRLDHVSSQYAFEELKNYAVMDSPEQAYKLKSSKSMLADEWLAHHDSGYGKAFSVYVNGDNLEQFDSVY